MAIYIELEDKTDYTGSCFDELDAMLVNLKKEALRYMNNHLITEDDYYYEYMQMRARQCVILKRIYADIIRLTTTPEQGKALADFIRQTADEHQKKIIASNFSTQVPKGEKYLGKNWQEYMFENMPVAAAVTMLSKIQSDVRYAEGEVLHNLVANIDMKDIRVNKLDAFVIPEKTTLYPGERFNANIVMAAVDTTQQPEIYVNGMRVNSARGQYSFTAGGVGEHQLPWIAILCMSGATLTKGPVGIILPCFVMGVFMLTQRENFWGIV